MPSPLLPIYTMLSIVKFSYLAYFLFLTSFLVLISSKFPLRRLPSNFMAAVTSTSVMSIMFIVMVFILIILFWHTCQDWVTNANWCGLNHTIVHTTTPTEYGPINDHMPTEELLEKVAKKLSTSSTCPKITNDNILGATFVGACISVGICFVFLWLATAPAFKG